MDVCEKGLDNLKSPSNTSEGGGRISTSFLAKATFIVMLGTFFSRISGLLREVAIAAYFGNGIAVDAYQVAYSIPNLFLQLFGSAAIGSSFIPVITRYLTKNDREDLDAVASSVANFLFLFFIFFMILGFIFTPFILQVIAPGFVGNNTKFDLAIGMTRTMLPTILFLGMAGFVMGMLHSFNHFIAPAFAPIALNLLMIVSILILTPYMGAFSLAVGVVIGSFCQFIVQLPVLKRRDWRYSFKFAWRHPGVRQVALLILPVVFTLASIEINVFIDTRFASTLQTGSIAALHYALRIWNLPMGLFAIAISTVLFPTFSKLSALNDICGLKETFARGIRMVLFIMVPCTFILIVMSEPIVMLLFERGAFGKDATYATVYALVFYTLGLTSTGLLHLTNRVFYSLKDTITPTLVTICAIIVNYMGDRILIGPLGHGGIALSTSLVMTFNFLFLIIILRKRVGLIGGRSILKTLFKVVIASSIFSLISYLAWRYTMYLFVQSFLSGLISVGLAFALGVPSYLITAKLLRIDELSMITGLLFYRKGVEK